VFIYSKEGLKLNASSNQLLQVLIEKIMTTQTNSIMLKGRTLVFVQSLAF